MSLKRINGNALPASWQASAPALRAVQVAFDVSESVIQAVRKAAFENGVSNSDQVRAVLGLGVVKQIKRPRLTVSLSPDDYAQLAARYRMKGASHLQIKERVTAELADFAAHQTHPVKSREATQKRGANGVGERKQSKKSVVAKQAALEKITGARHTRKSSTSRKS